MSEKSNMTTRQVYLLPDQRKLLACIKKNDGRSGNQVIRDLLRKYSIELKKEGVLKFNRDGRCEC